MPILDLFHHRFDLLRLGDIAIDYQRLLQFLRHRVGIGFVLALRISEIIHDAVCAALAESFDHFRADAAGTPGDQDNFVGKVERLLHLLRLLFRKVINNERNR